VILEGDTLRFHSGGYTPFYVDITGKEGRELEVFCDNFLDLDRIPLTSDFNKNGGLHYPVWLLECPAVHFSPEAYGYYRMHVSQKEVSDEKACGEAKTQIRNYSAQDQEVTVRWSLKDAAGAEVLAHNETVTLAGGSAQDVVWDYALENPHLWNGLEDPYLYTLTVGAGEDRAETEVGFRYFSIDREKGFFLNGKSYPLRGVCLHQDKYGIASAFSKADFDKDYAIIKELGCNFLRLAHYPHNDYAFRLCDRMGIVVQTEIPWVNNCGTEITEAYVQNIYDQMDEMVRSLYNHPSIVFWGMWNELDSWSHKRYKVQGNLDPRRVVDETARLYDYTKALDPYRLVGLTDDSVFGKDFYTELKADYYSENRYHGWYYSGTNFEALTEDMEWIRDNMGVANLSEYGLGINPYCHTWRTDCLKRDKTDSLHFEEYGNLFHESYAAQIARAPYMAFTSLWVLFDFAVGEREEGIMDSDNGVVFTLNEERKYLNNKGLITRERETFKDVFYLYKAWWNHNEETVYLTSRRLKYRPGGEPFTLTVYSNAPSLEVFCNGELIATASETGEDTGVVWKFPAQMGDSATTFRVQSPNGTCDEITFLPLNK
jgi:beta-galactosidase